MYFQDSNKPGRLAVFCCETSAPARLLDGILLFSPVKGASSALNVVVGEELPLLEIAAAFFNDLPVLTGFGTLVARCDVVVDDELSGFAHIDIAGSSRRISQSELVLIQGALKSRQLDDHRDLTFRRLGFAREKRQGLLSQCAYTKVCSRAGATCFNDACSLY